MGKIAVLAAALLVVGVPLARGQVVDPDRMSPLPRSGVEEIDMAKEKACACCQECEAATKSTKGKEEGPPVTSGCRNCCMRCGKVQQSPEKANPPEVVPKCP